MKSKFGDSNIDSPLRANKHSRTMQSGQLRMMASGLKSFTRMSDTVEESSDQTEDNRVTEDQLVDFKNETAPERLQKLSEFIDELHIKNDNLNDIQKAIENSMRNAKESIHFQMK